MDWNKVARNSRLSAGMMVLMTGTLAAFLGYAAWESNSLVLYLATVITVYNGASVAWMDWQCARLAAEAARTEERVNHELE